LFWDGGLGVTQKKAELLLQARAQEKGFSSLNTQQIPPPSKLRNLIQAIKKKGIHQLTIFIT
jgi:hypothetical protein